MNFFRSNKTIIKYSLLGLFVIWCVGFIFRSSIIGIDGNRYYCLFDDAMISMRYAWNFSHGNGLVWNQGIKVEGYSNLLMTLIMAISTFFLNKIQAVLIIQILGMIFLVCIGLVSVKINEIISEPKNSKYKDFVNILILFAVLTYYPLSYWSLMGMETGLLSLLLMSGIYYALRYTSEYKKRVLILCSIMFGLGFLTRNDSIIYAGLTFLLLLLSLFWEGNRKNIFGIFLTVVGIYSTFVIGQFLFRYLYYGKFVPNTYILKLVGMPFQIRIANGFGFLKPFLIVLLPLLLLVGFDILANKGKYKTYFLVMVGLSITYQIYVGGDPWRYWRMIAPLMPLLLILICTSTVNIAKALMKTSLYRKFFERKFIISKDYFLPSFSVVIIFGVMYLLNQPFLREALLLEDPYQVKNNYNNVNKAIVLNDITTDNATIGVFWAGTIPYYTDLKAIDFLGKSDSKIASLPPDLSGAVASNGMTSLPGHNKYNLDYSIKELQPTYVQGFSWGGEYVRDFKHSNYTKVRYKDISLYLLSGSPYILWEKVEKISE